MVRMLDAEVVSADLCDFGRCELGDNSKGRLDDIRRLGVMFFSLATGEGRAL